MQLTRLVPQTSSYMSTVDQRSSLFHTRALLGTIFEYLTSLEIVAVQSRVCRSFHYALRDLPALWTKLSRRHGWGESSRRRFIEHLRAVTCVRDSRVSQEVLSGHSAGVVLLHSPSTQSLYSWTDNRALTINEATLISAGSAPSFEFKVWDLERHCCVRDFVAAKNCNWTAAQLGDSHFVFARGGNAPVISVSDHRRGTQLDCAVGIHSSSITSLRFCPSSLACKQYFADSSTGAPELFCASGGYDRQVCVWNLTSGEVLATLTDHESAVWCVDIMQLEGDSRTIWVLSGDDSHTVRLFRLDFVAASPPWMSAGSAVDPSCWDIAHGSWRATCIHQLRGHTETPICVRFDPHQPQRYAYSSSYDGSIRLWNLETGECERIFTGATSVVFSIDISDPFVIYSCGRDETLRAHDKQTGELLQSVPLNTNQSQAFDLKSLIRLHDGRVAVASYDGTVKLIQFSRCAPRTVLTPMLPMSEPECSIM